MEQIGLTIWNMEEIMQKAKKTIALVDQGQIMKTIGLTLCQPNWALTLKNMAMLTQGSILRPETISPLQVDRHFQKISQDFSFSNFFPPDVGAAFNGDYSEDTDVSLGAPSKGSSNADEGTKILRPETILPLQVDRHLL